MFVLKLEMLVTYPLTIILLIVAFFLFMVGCKAVAIVGIQDQQITGTEFKCHGDQCTVCMADGIVDEFGQHIPHMEILKIVERFIALIKQEGMFDIGYLLRFFQQGFNIVVQLIGAELTG